MAGLRKTGLYTWDVKRLGTLPQPPRMIGFTPSGPVSIAATAPGATSTPTGWASVIQQILSAMGRAASFLDTHPGQMPYYTGAQQSDPDTSAAHLRMAAAFLGVVRPDASGNYNTAQIRASLESLGEFERAMLSLQLSGRDPSSDPLSPPLTFSVDTILADIAAGRVPGQKAADFSSAYARNVPSIMAVVPSSVTSNGVTTPSVPGAGSGSTTATTALQNGATGAGSAAAQTDAVVSQAGQDYTSIVNATGPSDSIPGYNVNQTLAPLPSSSPFGDATWWKPALAIAIGAAVGVGLGRVIASR